MFSAGLSGAAEASPQFAWSQHQVRVLADSQCERVNNASTGQDTTGDLSAVGQSYVFFGYDGFCAGSVSASIMWNGETIRAEISGNYTFTADVSEFDGNFGFASHDFSVSTPADLDLSWAIGSYSYFSVQLVDAVTADIVFAITVPGDESGSAVVPLVSGRSYELRHRLTSGNQASWQATLNESASDCPADLTTTGSNNGVPDGAVDISDFSFYLTLWAAGDAAADVTTTGTSNGTPDGVVDVSDFSFYLTLWAAGCP